MKFTIIGAGNGGLAFSAKLKEKGHTVNLYDKFKEIIDPIILNNNIITHNNINHIIDLVTDNLQVALEGSEYVFIITPSFAHKDLSKELVKYIDNQTIVLHPGRTGGAIQFKRVFEFHDKHNIIGETETLLFACRKEASTEITIYGTKKSVGLATIPKEKAYQVVKDLNSIFSYFVVYNNVLVTSFSNIGAMLHPTLFLFNLSRIDNADSYNFYKEGISPSVAKFIEKLDYERLLISKAYDIDVTGVYEWLEDKYGRDNAELYDRIRYNPEYQDIVAPESINSRYILEDIPMSLVPLYYLAKGKNINVPTIELVINLASSIYNQNFLETGRRICNIQQYS